MVEIMFSKGINYFDNNQFNFDLTDNVIKAFDYFDIKKETYKKDFKFLIKLIVSIWQGEPLKKQDLQDFKLQCIDPKSNLQCTSYFPIIQKILRTFRVINPQQRFQPSKQSYEDICKIIKFCQDISYQKKEPYFASELILKLSTYGYKIVDENGKSKTMFLHQCFQDHQMWNSDDFWKTFILIKVTEVIINAKIEKQSGNSEEDFQRSIKMQDLKKVQISNVFLTEAYSMKQLGRKIKDYEKIILPLVKSYDLDSESQEDIKGFFV